MTLDQGALFAIFGCVFALLIWAACVTTSSPSRR
jgi:hypothetical protein